LTELANIAHPARRAIIAILLSLRAEANGPARGGS